MKNHAKEARVHAFGIGSGADKALVRRLAEAGGGIHDFVEAFDRTMESKVMDALREAMIVSCLFSSNFPRINISLD